MGGEFASNVVLLDSTWPGETQLRVHLEIQSSVAFFADLSETRNRNFARYPAPSGLEARPLACLRAILPKGHLLSARSEMPQVQGADDRATQAYTGTPRSEGAPSMAQRIGGKHGNVNPILGP